MKEASGADIQEKLDSAKTLYNQGNFSAAAAHYRAILELAHQHPEALNMLGVIAHASGKSLLAIDLFESAIGASPDFFHARYNRALVLHALGRDQEALHAVRMICDADPSLSEAWDMTGMLLQTTGDAAEADKAFATALALSPDHPDYLDHYAQFLLGRGDLVAAYRAARRACDIAPDFLPMTLGSVLKAMGHPALAAPCFAAAYAQRPALTDAAVSAGMAWLQCGDGARGWPLWEQRPDMEAARLPFPLWQGEKINHLLLYEDQGMGDALHFARYIPLLATVAQITLRLRAPLHRLFAANFPMITLIQEDAPLPRADARCRLSSLAAIFARRDASLPAAPYLKADATLRDPWRLFLRDRFAPRIGLVWAGNPLFRQDAARSIRSDRLHPLLGCGSQHFVSLQKDGGAGSDSLFAAGVTDAAATMRDFADTAALIMELDLVIAVDTATAHLAGALGKPVFILLPFDSDWRWLMGREDSPWYPTARLFRQTKPGDWDSVIARVAQEISKLMQGDASVLQPARWQQENLHQNPHALPLPQ